MASAAAAAAASKRRERQRGEQIISVVAQRQLSVVAAKHTDRWCGGVRSMGGSHCSRGGYKVGVLRVAKMTDHAWSKCKLMHA
jgi:hypothetical protein